MKKLISAFMLSFVFLFTLPTTAIACGGVTATSNQVIQFEGAFLSVMADDDAEAVLLKSQSTTKYKNILSKHFTVKYKAQAIDNWLSMQRPPPISVRVNLFSSENATRLLPFSVGQGKLYKMKFT